MKVRETRIAKCAFSAAIEIAKEYFERRDEPGRARAGAPARRRPSCVVVRDHTDRARYHDALHLCWCGHEALAPATFEGLLTVRPASGDVELILEGDIVGAGSADALLGEIASYVEREWSHFVAETPTIDACNARAHAGMALA
ncbi:MAG: hypothetical protein NVS2B3_04280 [Vulcanimicrobiaceae bacterium]